MIKDIIDDLEAKIRAESLGADRKNELLKLLAALKTETAALEDSQAAMVQTREALKEPTEELRSSLSGFEQSHPKLVQAINTISNTLSNIGI